MVDPSSEVDSKGNDSQSASFNQSRGVERLLFPSDPEWDEEADISESLLLQTRIERHNKIRDIQKPLLPSTSSSVAHQDIEQSDSSSTALLDVEDTSSTAHGRTAVYITFMLSIARFVFNTFTYHAELNSAEHANTFEDILKKNLVEWYTVGAFVSQQRSSR